jgi:F-type H+-transporting ATPase subunit delta
MAEPVTLARPYARAAFETAYSDGALAHWQSMLTMAGAVISDRKVSSVLASPKLTAEQQVNLLFGLCGDGLDSKGQNFILALSKYKRLSLMPEIARQYVEMKAKQEKFVEVSVLSAFPLSDEVSSQLSLALGRKWNCQVQIKATVDASLLGGAIIKAGDTVIDGSVRGRMQKLADALGA